MIERKNVDEAIAHSRHILSSYPKHLDTYRMLGKALLEKGRHGDAADVFQRVLSVLPDDFISHVGMAIVREDEANLDAALWHMERAFEAMPSNGAIQQELCRLYGRRDGVVPPKARLTRGALGRMYTQGGLYVQAEAELKAALSVDPDRIDLQTILAQVYWYSDQHAQAAQLCGSIVQQLPYSQVGNRILREIFRSRGRASDAALYRQRLEALDPYEALAAPASDDGSLSTTEQVDANQVLVTRLEYVAGMEGSGGPDWITSIGARFEEPLARAGENTPDWLNAAAEPPAPFDSADLPGTSTVPDWLSAASPANEMAGAGAGESLPSWLNELSEAGAASAPAPVADADLPDWLKGATGPLADEDVPAWMQTVSSASATKPLDSAGTDETMPGWLAAAQQQAAQPESFAASDPLETLLHPVPVSDSAPGTPAPDSDLPDWLRDAPPAPNLGDDLPDWLKASTGSLPEMPAWTTHPTEEAAPSMAAHEAAPDAAPEVAPWLAGMDTAAPTVPDLTADDDLPDWMKPEVSNEAPAAAVASALLTETPVASPGESVPDWLAEGTSSPAADDLPPWMQDAGLEAPAPVASTAPPSEAPALPADDVPAWLSAVAPAAASVEPAPSAPEGALAADDIPDWLAAIAPAQAADEVPPWLQPPDAAAPPPAALEAAEPLAAVTGGDVPDWLEAATASTPADEALPWLQTTPSVEPALAPLAPAETPAVPVEQPVTGDELPDWLSAASASSPEDEVPAWLQTPAAEDAAGLAASAALSSVSEPEAPSFEPAAPMDEVPSWLNTAPANLAPETGAAEASRALEGEALPAEADGLPDWLQAVSAASPADEVPDWLQASPTDPVEASASLPEPPAPPQPFDPIAAAEAEDARLPSGPANADDTLPATPPADVPDWLRALVDDTEDNRTAQWEAAAEAEFGAVLPGDLEEADTEEPEQPLPEGVPDWMQAMADSAPAPDSPAVAAATPPEAPTQPAVELPDFLQLASPEAIARASMPFEAEEEPEPELASAELADEPEALQPADLPDWLRALAPDAPASTPAPAFDADIMAAAAAGLNLDEAPDWLKSAQPGAPTDPFALDVGLAASLAPADQPPAAEGGPDLNLDDAPDWLQAAATLTPAEPSSAEAAPDAEAETPAWLQEPSADLPPWAQTEAPGPTDTVINFLRGKDLPDELKQLREQASQADAPEPPAPASEPAVELPADEMPTLALNLQAEQTPPAVEPAPVADAPAVALEPNLDEMTPDETMRWLESLAARQGASADELFMGPPPMEAAPALPVEPALPMEATPDLARAEAPQPVSDWLAEIEAQYPVDPLADTAPRKTEAPTLDEVPATALLAAALAEPDLPDLSSPTDVLEVPVPALAAIEPTSAVGAPPSPTDAELPDIESMDADEAMAWLEKLAAQQGASAEELLSAPEDRPSETPAWIAAEQAAAEAEPALEPGLVPDWLAELKAAETPEAPLEPAELPNWLKPAAEAALTAEPETAQAALSQAETAPESEPDFASMDADAAMAWLEGLAAQQGANPDELITAPEARAAETPAWIVAEQVAAEQAPALDTPLPELPAEAMPAVLEAAPVEPIEPARAEAPVPPSEPAEPAHETASLQPDVSKLARLSDRLAATRRAKEAEIEARFAQQRAEQEEARRLVWESMQAKKAAVESAAEALEPSAPAAPAPEAPAPPPAVPAPTVPAAPQRRVTGALPPLPVAVDDSAWVPTRPPARLPSRYAGQKYEAVLKEARAHLQQHDEASAADALDHLVTEGQFVEDIIADLEAAATPTSVPLLRVLGDAYARNNRVEQALETYRQALRRLS